MFPLNILSCFWIVCIAAFTSLFVLKRLPSMPRLPNVLWNLSTYGKVRDMPAETRRKWSSLDRLLDVPKQWFTHYYAVSVLCNSFLLFKLLEIVLYKGQMPEWYLDILHFLTDFPLETPKASQLSVIIAVTLLLFQGGRRLYECLCVSSYSKSTIHVSHYILGIVFYAFGGLSIVAEGPDFRRAAPYDNVLQLAEQVTWFNIAGVVMFFWATYHHHVAHKIFARLRKGDKDTKHRIPRGDWFDLVSCPHYLAEILIYASLALVLGLRHSMVYLVLGFTMSNQVFFATIVHDWYRQTFPNYPKTRKAVIPWLI